MKNNLIKILSLIIVFGVVTGLCSCRLTHKETAGIMTTNRSLTLSSASSNSAKSTDLSVTAVAPEGKEAIIKYFNGSLEYFYNNDFEFVRKKTTTLSSYSAGTLASVTGATQSYQSMLKSSCADMMGVGSLETTYYVGDDISWAFAIKEVNPELLKKCSASADGNKVKVSFEYKSLTGDDETTLTNLTRDFMTTGSFSQKISSYGASSSETSSSISGIKLSAVIDYSTRNFTSLKIEYTTAFKAQQISFDYVSGGPVSGTTKTVISYGNIEEV